MKLLQFTIHGEHKLGCELEDNSGKIIDLTGSNHDIPNDMKTFIEGGEDMLLAAQRLLYLNLCLCTRWRWQTKLTRCIGCFYWLFYCKTCSIILKRFIKIDDKNRQLFF